MFPKENLHHAYFIEGNRQAVLADVEAFLKSSFGIERQGNPDVHFAEYESFGIDESRDIQAMQSMRPIASDKKIFIIATDAVTHEAQNSLLKVFEEPTEGTHFFVISSSRRILLPTLKSRMVTISHPSAQTEVGDEEIKKFLKLTAKDRIAYVAPIIEEKDKAKAESFLSALVSLLHKKKPMPSASIKEIITLTKYLKDRSSSIKLILERVALLDL